MLGFKQQFNPQGVHPPENKLTSGKPIEVMGAPSRVFVPLRQHIGGQCSPTVKAGDKVNLGQVVGISDAFCSAPVHSSVSGVVVSIESLPHPLGQNVLTVVIESDGKDTLDDSIKPTENPLELKPKEIVEAVKKAGVVGMGGASFPTHVKLCPPEGTRIDAFILNGAECEPYLTVDHRLMLEKTGRILEGFILLMKAVGAERGFVAIEDNKRDAIDAMRSEARKYGNVEVVSLPKRYPMGEEKTLIKTLTGREIRSGGLPYEVGVVVDNVGTALAVRDAVFEGKPVYERVITVSGPGVKSPKNLLVRVGTPFSEAISNAGGYDGAPGKIIMGGPMMGLAQYTDEVPVVKGTTGIIVFDNRSVARQERRTCVRCGRCVESCPYDLLPYLLGRYADKDMFESAEKYGALSCVECGCCAYACPSKIPLVQLIRYAKCEILARRKMNAAK